MNRMVDPQNEQEKKNSFLEEERNALALERTRLASERTLLSWIRTGLTGVGLGIAIARFLYFKEAEHQMIARYLGQLLIIWGIGIFIFSLFSYRHSYRKLEIKEGYRNTLIGITVIISFLVLFSLILIWIAG